jgi:hypothetical protein
LAPCEAHDAPAEQHEALVASPIGLKRASCRVHVAPVDFDDQALRAPHEVTLRSATIGIGDPRVHAVRRQSRATAEREEALLKLATRQRAAGPMVVQDRRQHPGAAMPVRSCQHVIDRAHVKDPQLLRAIDRTLELALRCARSQIEKRARERRARDRTDDGDIARGQRSAAVHAQTITPTAGACG